MTGGHIYSYTTILIKLYFYAKQDEYSILLRVGNTVEEEMDEMGDLISMAETACIGMHGIMIVTLPSSLLSAQIPSSEPFGFAG